MVGLYGTQNSLLRSANVLSLLLHTHLNPLTLCFLAVQQDPDADIRQSGFALVGDLAKACAPHIKPALVSRVERYRIGFRSGFFSFGLQHPYYPF